MSVELQKVERQRQGMEMLGKQHTLQNKIESAAGSCTDSLVLDH